MTQVFGDVFDRDTLRPDVSVIRSGFEDEGSMIRGQWRNAAGVEILLAEVIGTTFSDARPGILTGEHGVGSARAKTRGAGIPMTLSWTGL